MWAHQIRKFCDKIILVQCGVSWRQIVGTLIVAFLVLSLLPLSTLWSFDAKESHSMAAFSPLALEQPSRQSLTPPATRKPFLGVLTLALLALLYRQQKPPVQALSVCSTTAKDIKKNLYLIRKLQLEGG